MKINNTYQKITVFIVDDDEVYLGLIKSRVQNIGLKNIFEFTSGEACVANIDKKPDIVILDLNLGEINGLDVLKYIKIHSPSTYVIVFSSETQNKIIFDSIVLGAYDFVGKNTLSFGKLELLIKHLAEKISIKKHEPNFMEMLMSLFF